MGKYKDSKVFMRLYYNDEMQDVQVKQFTLGYQTIKMAAQSFIRTIQFSDIHFHLEYYEPDDKQGQIKKLQPSFKIYKDQILKNLDGILVIIINPADQVYQELQRQIRQLNNRVQKLQQQIKIIKLNQSQKQQSPSLTITHRKTSLHQKLLDVGILFSDPLVSYTSSYKAIPQVEPVSYRSQINRLRQQFSKAPLTIRCQVATLQNLAHIIDRSPQILHIICHGQTSKQGYQLSFQSHENIGTKIKLTNQNLRDLYHKRQSSDHIKVIFVNACHSQYLSRIFIDQVGAHYAVAVQSQQKIQDKTALVFAYNFYNCLINCRPIPQAFKYAKEVTRQQMGCQRTGCCCIHSHQPNCLFLQLQSQYGQRTAHQLFHVPPKSCNNCKQKLSGIHRIRCSWAISTIKRININYRQFDQQQFSSYDGIKICCCSLFQDYQKHQQTQKFKLLIGKNASPAIRLKIHEQTQFQDQTGPQLQSWYCKHSSSHFIGRNLQLQSIAKHIRGSDGRPKVVLLVGAPGSGKSQIARRACQYVIQRGGFPNGLIQLNFEQCTSQMAFNFKLTQSLQNFKLNETIEHYRNKSCIFIFDDLDSLFKAKGQSIIQPIKSFIIGCGNCRFLLIFRTNTIQALLNKTASKFFSANQILLKVQPFSTYHAASLLLSQGKSYIQSKYYDPKVLSKHKIFKLIELYPRTILDLVQYLAKSARSGISIDKYAQKMQQQLQIQKKRKVQENQIRIKNINLLKQTDQNAYQLLIMLAQFPAGLTLNDLKIMGQSQYGFIPVKWRSCLLGLLSFEDQNYSQRVLQSNAQIQIQAIEIGKYYFIVKEQKSNQYFYKVEGLVRQVILLYKQKLFLSKQRQSILFIHFYLNYLISQFTDKHIYHQNWIQFSQLSKAGIWGVVLESGFYKDIFSYYIKQQIIQTKGMVDSVARWRRVQQAVKRHQKKNNISYQKQFIRHHDNFLRIIQQMIQFFQRKQNIQNIQPRIIYAIQNILLSVPSIFKLLGRQLLADNTALTGLTVLRKMLDMFNDLKIKNSSISLSMCKLTILRFSLQSNNQQEYDQLLAIQNCFKQAYRTLDQNCTQLFQIFNMDYYFYKSHLLYKQVKKKKENDIKHLLTQLSNFQKIKSQIIQTAFVIPPNIKITIAKFQFLNFKCQCKFKQIAQRQKTLLLNISSMNAIQQLQKKVLEIIKEINDKSLTLLKIKTYLNIVKYRLHNSQTNYRKLKYQYIQDAIDLKNNTGLNLQKLQQKISFYQNQVNNHIVRSIKHIVRFLKSQVSDNSMFVPSFCFWKTFSQFQKVGRQLVIKSQIFNPENLYLTLKEGSHILAFAFSDLSISSNEQIIFDQLLGSKPINLNEILTEQSYTNPQILIICGNYANKIGMLFSQKICPKVIIQFELVPKTQLSRYSDKQYQIKAIQCFMIKIVQYFYKGQNLSLAFQKAVSQTKYIIIKSSRKQITNQYIFQKKIGKFYMLSKQDLNFSKIMCQSKVGKFHNMTFNRAKKNFDPPEIRFIGQKQKIIQLLVKINQKNLATHFNLYGNQKTDKPKFALQLASIFWQRRIFKDGVFLLNCLNYNNLCLRDFIQNQVGYNFYQIIREGKNIQAVMIFENFNSILQNYNRDILFDFIFKQLFKNGVCIIMITRTRIRKQKYKNIFDSIDIQYIQLNQLDTTHCLLYLQKILIEQDPEGQLPMSQANKLANKHVPLSKKVSDLNKKIHKKKKLKTPKKNNYFKDDIQEVVDIQAQSEQFSQSQQSRGQYLSDPPPLKK